MEIWKIIPETNDLYEASNVGNIRRVPGYVTNRADGGKRKVGGKVLSQKTKPNGYKEVNLYIVPQVSKMAYVHRLIAAAFLGCIPEGREINHIDGDKSNNKIINLEIVTPKQNRLHSYHVLNHKNLKSLLGENHPNTRITDADVLHIRQEYKFGESNATLYEQYKDRISLSCFRKICYGSSFKHLKSQQ